MFRLCLALHFLSAFAADQGDCDSRYVVLDGNTGDRGAGLVQARGAAIRRLWKAKLASYGKTPGAIEAWEAMAQLSLEHIMHEAPVAWGELKGAVLEGESQGIDLKVMVMLALEYDFSMGQGTRPEKCTAFATPGLVGQNNDEDMSGFLDGSEDTVFLMKGGNEPAALVYTHPGMPAYMGMNENGVSVLWQAIDDGERGIGVPTTVLIREMLAQTSLEAALKLLERSPRIMPNNFIVSDGSRVVNCEVSPNHYTATVITRGFVVHTNHILFDQNMQDHDVYKHDSTASTMIRYKAMREMARQHATIDHGVVDVAVSESDLEGMLSTRPILRDGLNGTDNATLASMLFNPVFGRLNIRFRSNPLGSFCSYRVSNGAVTIFA